MKFDQKTADDYAKSVMHRQMAVELNPSLQIIAEGQARKNHEAWRKDKESKGYIYGEKTNDDISKGPLTNPLLVDF